MRKYASFVVSQYNEKTEKTEEETLECVGLSFPCERDYGWRFHRDACSLPDDGHGHILLTDDGLQGRPPVAIYSRQFLGLILGELEVSDGLVDMIMRLPETQTILPELTEQEKELLNDPEKLKLSLGCVLVGA